MSSALGVPGIISELLLPLRRLRLPTVRARYPELAAQALAEGWSYAEYPERLLTEEIAQRTESRIARATRRAGFPFLKTLEEFDFTFQRSLQRKALGPEHQFNALGGRRLVLDQQLSHANSPLRSTVSVTRS